MAKSTLVKSCEQMLIGAKAPTETSHFLLSAGHEPQQSKPIVCKRSATTLLGATNISPKTSLQESGASLRSAAYCYFWIWATQMCSENQLTTK
jgi:hypothetical protein